jgi:WD40 repeat protein
MHQLARDSCRRDVWLAAVAASIPTLVLLTPARGAEQQPGLTARREIVRLSEPPQNGRVYDLTFSPRRDSVVCAFALEQAVQVWDVSAKPRCMATFNPPRPTNVVALDFWGDAHGLAFSSDGGRLAMGYFSSIQI